ncbi:uncharacterized protein LOC142144885 [Mixophyes fleayi]|uniref:uncharacterized protein LOC142144885 n=1 Tax=Mixophyes fleayi TaxID=3061075 RepID=UPI003F4DE061
MEKRKEEEEEVSSLNKKQKKHLKDFGEQHPINDQISKTEEKTPLADLPDTSDDESRSESEVESEPENFNIYRQLLAALTHASDDEEEDDDKDVVDEVNEGTVEAASKEELSGDKDAEESKHVSAGEEGKDVEGKPEPKHPAQEAESKLKELKELSDFDKGQIFMARRLGQSIAKTAGLVGCSRLAVLSTYSTKCEKKDKAKANVKDKAKVSNKKTTTKKKVK